MSNIDFVLVWVDNTSRSWNEQRRAAWIELHPGEHDAEEEKDNGACRYREMGTLRYWFRSVEKFAPWVNKVYFVTCGQQPSWLNIHHPKLVRVNHEDYIPSKYLPTFNSNPIELNLHRIPELSENFVLFNDDVFLLRPVSPEFFFINDEPVLPCDLSICDYFGYNNWSFSCFNDYCVLNDSFNLYESIWNNRHKWFNVKELGIRTAVKNFLCYKLNRTLSLRGYEHLANAQLKSTIRQIWEKWPDILDGTSCQRFRSSTQVNQWLACAWNQASGKFYPARPYSHGSHFNVSTAQLDYICSIIKNQSIPQICVNDSADNDDPDRCFLALKEAFEAILPDRSSFESEGED